MLRKAQTSYLFSIIVVQWADVIICKTRVLSIFQHGVCGIPDARRAYHLALVVTVGLVHYGLVREGWHILNVFSTLLGPCYACLQNS
eukprot:COSAG01_NODE_52886_length_343_cov_0.881148_1_plen_87_part_00